MLGSERAAVSGAALALLLHECAGAGEPQEGFLLGRVSHSVTNHISDVQQDNQVTDVAVNVVSVLPCPDRGIFYTSSGRIKEQEVADLLAELAPKVIGWYKYRPNGSLKTTMRDKVVSKGLQKLFERHTRYFMYCNITSKQNCERSTHTYTYRFSKLDDRGNMNPIEDVTSNLGEKVSGYKSGSKGERNDPFNVAVRNATGQGMMGIKCAVEDALSSAAKEAIDKERDLKKVTNDIRILLKQLADNYKNRSILEPTRQERIAQEEREHIQPVLNSINAEPFSFVDKIIQKEAAKPKSFAKIDKTYKEPKNSHNKQNEEFFSKSSTSKDVEFVGQKDEFAQLDQMETSSCERK